MRGVGALAAIVLLGGCANYDERIREAHIPYYSGRPDEAIEWIEEEMEDEEDDRLLLSLELAMVLQSVGRYEESSQLLIEADDQLEVFDYTTNSIEDISDFAFGSEIATYQGNRPERVMVNTQNMINFLGMRDATAAAVEARRVRTLLTQDDVPYEERYSNRFAWSLAAFALEMAGRYGEAEDAYRELGDTPLTGSSLAAGQAATNEPPGTILVVTQTGKVPIRIESVYVLIVAGRVHRLNLPTLVSRPGAFETVSVDLDDVPQGQVEVLFDLGAHMRKRFEDELPRLLAAAAGQAGVRAAVTTARTAGQSATDDEVASALIAVGALLGEWLWAEAAGADTRCWTILPDRFGAMRLTVPPGEHMVTVTLAGRRTATMSFPVTVESGGFSVVNVHSGTQEGFEEVRVPGSRDMTGTTQGEQALRALEASLLWYEILN